MGKGPASRNTRRTLVSLFTGAGGLDLGLEAAGFSASLCVEVDDDARRTLAANRPDWKLAHPGDIERLTPNEILLQAGLAPREVTLLAGGPPCQPFSKSAYWATGGREALKDPRAGMLRAYLKVVEATLPQVLLLENVRGLATTNGEGGGLQFLQEGLHEINRRQKTKYRLQAIHLNAADYGVPQIRERLFLVATISGQEFMVPPPTHGEGSNLEKFLTAWDAIGDLDSEIWPSDLNPSGKWAGLISSIPEGGNYLWHTHRGGGEPLFGWRTRFWSFLLKLAKNRPSWTIQAAPGPATGPFHWRNRFLSIEELARLQTFPQDYTFYGERRSVHRQIGNAVPSAVGELLGLEIRRQFLGEKRVRRHLSLIPRRSENCPEPQVTTPVPSSYLKLRGNHPDHPGKGRGPGKVWADENEQR